MQPPTSLTRLEWEAEVREFEAHLSPELRALLPSVRSRQEPLAKLATAQPFADQLKMRFASEKNEDTKAPESRSDAVRRQAVKEKQFGYRTRDKYTWHPSPLLCKYFNVENPYPGSQMVGCLELQKRISNSAGASSINALGNLGMPNTQRDVIDRLEQEAHQRRVNRTVGPAGRQDGAFDVDKRDEKFKETAEFVDKPIMLPPIELLQSVFEEATLASTSSSSSSSDAEETAGDYDEDEASPQNAYGPMPPTSAFTSTIVPKSEKVITVLDLVPDDEYGPAIPATLPDAIPPEEKAKFVPTAPEPAIIQLDDDDNSAESSDDKRAKRAHKKRRHADDERSRKHSKKHKKKHKSKSKSTKTSKKQSKRRHSSSSSSSSSS